MPRISFLRWRALSVMALMTILALTATYTATARPGQTPQKLAVGVIGQSDGPTAQGIALALSHLPGGTVTAPDGKPYVLDVQVAEAQNPADVKTAIDNLSQKNLVALFGPDDDALAVQSASILAGPGAPVFMSSASSSVKTGGAVFRTRAANTVQMSALVDVLLNDVKKSQIAVYQGAAEYSDQTTAFVLALAKRNIKPTTTVLQVTNSPITESVKVILGTPPEAIAAFGSPLQVSELYRELRAGGFNGIFITPTSENHEFIRAVPLSLRGGIYGVTSWSYVSESKESIDFTRSYIKAFGEIPNTLSAAAYDATNALVMAIQQTGTAPAAITAKLSALPAFNAVQGNLNPSIGNGELSAYVMVTTTGPYGAPVILNRFNGAERLPVDAPPASTATPQPIIATFTLVPSVPTIVPSATLDGVYGVVTSNVLNIRSGPGLFYEKLGSLNRGQQVKLIGANADFSWYVFVFRNQQAWLIATGLSILGDQTTLPIMQAPPTPTAPPATFTPTPQPFADLVMISAALNPPVPQPGAPFTLSVIVRNQGSANAGQFAVATSFKPGDVFSSAIVPSLAGGQEATVNLTATVNGTTYDTIAIVLDLNNQVDEGPNGKANNKPTFTYKVDRPYLTSGNMSLASGQGFDFDGGGNDITFKGSIIFSAPSGGVAVVNVPVAQIHRDLLAGSLPAPNPNGSSVGGPPAPGTVIALRTTGGKIGFIHINSYNGPNVQFDFAIYQ